MRIGLTQYRKTSFIVPIFNQRIYVFLLNSLNDIRNLYSIDESVDLNDRQAVVFTHQSGEIAVFESTIRNSLIAHESLHLAKRIMKKVGIKANDLDNSELECYLTGYIVEKISVWFEKLENEDSKTKTKK